MATKKSANELAVEAAIAAGTSTDGILCAQFCCSEFYNYQEAANLTTGTDELTNIIHAIFAAPRFINFNRNNYEAFKPVLRLATKLIRTDKFVEYISTAVYGNLWIDVHPNNRGSSRLVKPGPLPAPSAPNHEAYPGHNRVFQQDYISRRYYRTDNASIDRGLRQTRETAEHFLQRVALFRMPKRGQKKATPALRARAMLFLHNMKDMVDFEHCRLANANGQEAVNGRHIPIPDPLTPALQARYPRRRRSRIQISSAAIRDLGDLQQTFDESQTGEAELRAKQFTLSITIVHELAHCINAVVNNHTIGRRVGFRENACVETGFDLIAHIFGGNIQDGDQILPVPAGPHAVPEELRKNYLIRTEWPSELKYRLYTDGGKNISRRGALPPIDVITRIPHAYMFNLFTNTFWNNLGNVGNQRSLKPQGPRWTLHKPQAGRRPVLSTLVDVMPRSEVHRLLAIVTRQPSIKKALAALEDDLFIFSTAADITPRDGEQAKVVSSLPHRRGSRALSKGITSAAAKGAVVKKSAAQGSVVKTARAGARMASALFRSATNALGCRP